MANERDDENFGEQERPAEAGQERQQPTGQQGQPPIGQQGQQSESDQQGQQPNWQQGQQSEFATQGQQPSGQQGQQGQQSEFGQQGQDSSGQAESEQGGDTETLSTERGFGQGADTGGSGGSGGTGGFVGSQGTGSGEHLQVEGSPGGSDFANQGQGASGNPDEDIETGQPRRDNDIEGGTGS